MTWVVVGCAAIAVAVIALSLRSEAEPSEHEAGPKPGEGLPRHDWLLQPPSGMVALRAALPTEEAYVAHGLLTANGIVAALTSANPIVEGYTRVQPLSMSLYVDPARYDDADALLRGEGLGGD